MTYTKIYRYGLELAQKCGRWQIINDNLAKKKYDSHWCIVVQCECGTIDLLRVDFFRDKRSLGCKKCVNKDDYPTKRKSRVKYYKGLNNTFLSRLKYHDNLYRGNYKIIVVSLTIEDLYNKLVEQNFKCALSGLDLDVLNLPDIYQSNASIDRIDSCGNYTPNNIQWVHKDINRMKNSIPQDNFINLCKLISEKNYLYDNSEPS